MSQRVTEKQLQDMAAHLSSVTGLNITKGGAYGGTCFQIGHGSENLTGYVTKAECMAWAYAFLKGVSIGATKHKHDMMKTIQDQPLAHLVQNDEIMLVCGDCGQTTTTRYESSYEIGIAPFRWLCYSCWNKIQRPEEYAEEFTPCIRCHQNTDLACNECGMPCCTEHGEMIDGEWYCADIPASV